MAQHIEVLVFVQEGCAACHDILPIIDRISAHYGACVATRVVDAHREGIFADTMQIQETPTVIGCQDFRPVVRLVGGNDFEQRVAGLYDSLLDGASCPVGVWKGDV